MIGPANKGRSSEDGGRNRERGWTERASRRPTSRTSRPAGEGRVRATNHAWRRKAGRGQRGDTTDRTAPLPIYQIPPGEPKCRPGRGRARCRLTTARAVRLINGVIREGRFPSIRQNWGIGSRGTFVAPCLGPVSRRRPHRGGRPVHPYAPRGRCRLSRRRPARPGRSPLLGGRVPVDLRDRPLSRTPTGLPPGPVYRRDRPPVTPNNPRQSRRVAPRSD